MDVDKEKNSLKKIFLFGLDELASISKCCSCRSVLYDTYLVLVEGKDFYFYCCPGCADHDK